MKVKIIGYGKSGKAAESYLEKKHIETVVVKDHKEQSNDKFDFVVISPGVPAEAVENIEEPVVPEVELAFYIDPGIKPKSLVAVTGTNGKTTIVNQIYDMCVNAGLESVLCGNVGTPISYVADKLSGSIVVLEVSSFMLEQTKLLRPNIAVITNVTSDHLDRHKSMQEYIRCKKQITAYQKASDILVVNWDDENSRSIGLEIIKKKKQKVVWYSTQETIKGFFIKGDYIYESKWYGARRLLSINSIGSMPHTLSNTLAVVAVGKLLGIKNEKIKLVCQYKKQRHRIERVLDNNGVVYYNDSKSTNIASTVAAVKSFALPINLILCGKSKGQDYKELFPLLPENILNIIVFGESKNEVEEKGKQFGFKNIFKVDNLEQAVSIATEKAVKPGVVLFSPAGSSFDQFKDYKDRGDKFCKLVKQTIL